MLLVRSSFIFIFSEIRQKIHSPLHTPVHPAFQKLIPESKFQNYHQLHSKNWSTNYKRMFYSSNQVNSQPSLPKINKKYKNLHTYASLLAKKSQQWCKNRFCFLHSSLNNCSNFAFHARDETMFRHKEKRESEMWMIKWF